jgi:hypothetical protein
MSKKTKVVDPYSLNEEDRRKFYEKEQQRARETEEKRRKEEEKAKKKEWEKQSAKRKKEEEKAKKKEAKGTKKDKKGGKGDEPMVGRVIGTPTNFKREMHIGFNPDTGMFEVLFATSTSPSSSSTTTTPSPSPCSGAWPRAVASVERARVRCGGAFLLFFIIVLVVLGRS